MQVLDTHTGEILNSNGTGEAPNFFPVRPNMGSNMLQSADVSEVATALAAAQAELDHANKNSDNPHFKSKYADLAEVIDTFRPVFAKHGLSVVQRNFPNEHGVTLVTTIFHKSGQWISDAGLQAKTTKNDAQGTGSALTYARRYGLSSMIGIAPDEDDDGNAAVGRASNTNSVTRLSAPAPMALTANQRNTIIDLSLKVGATKAEAEKLAADTTSAGYSRLVDGLEKRVQKNQS